MRAPAVPATDIGELDVAIFGVPFDGGVTNRPGARHGPREVRNASSLTRAVNHATRINPYEICRIADAGDVPLSSPFEVAAAHRDIADFTKRLVRLGVTPLAVGGDHSVTLPLMRGLHEGGKLESGQKLGLVHIDAHTDTWDAFMNEKLHHGAPFRRAVEQGLLDPERTIQIGIRGAQNTDEGWKYSEDQGMKILYIEDVKRLGAEGVAAEARRVVGDGPTYISFDIDALDPVYAPGTGTPEVGGWDPLSAFEMLRLLRGLDIVGADMVEVSPPFDLGNLTAQAGATVAYELLCLLAESHVDGGGP